MKKLIYGISLLIVMTVSSLNALKDSCDDILKNLEQSIYFASLTGSDKDSVSVKRNNAKSLQTHITTHITPNLNLIRIHCKQDIPKVIGYLNAGISKSKLKGNSSHENFTAIIKTLEKK